jgi:hypothetical protein
MKKQMKRLALSRETLRALEQRQLGAIAGGTEQSVDVCTNYCTHTECHCTLLSNRCTTATFAC